MRFAGFVAAGTLAFPAPAGAQAPSVDVPSMLTPPEVTLEISSFGGHVTWVQKLPDRRGRDVDVVVDRANGRTTALPIAARGLVDLDLGPGADGTPVAAYARCTPSCDLWRFDFTTGRETRLRLSVEGVSEHLPSIWGNRIAFTRRFCAGDPCKGHKVLIGDVRRRRSRSLTPTRYPDDIELGPRHVAYTGSFDTGQGNGTIRLRVRSLPGRRERTLASHVIGEATSAGFGALTFVPPRLYFQSRLRDGCRVFKPEFVVWTPGDRRAQTISAQRAPLAVQHAANVPPPTPETDLCEPEEQFPPPG